MSENISIQTVEYKGWPNCIQLANGKVELVITTDVGPRIISYALKGGANVFKNYDAMMGRTGDAEWNIYGGHRLWHAPEGEPRSYFPDNSPIQWKQVDGGAKFIQTTEATTGIAKEIEVRLSAHSTRVEVVHRLINNGIWPVELAPWSLSVMDIGGRCIFPLPPRGKHPASLLPGSLLSIWVFTNLADPRWSFGEKFIMLQQDTGGTKPQKLGASVPDGWAAYANKNQLFIKQFAFDARAQYADLGCNFETFTNEEMLEVESLGPLTNLAPGESVEHAETWHLFDGVATPQTEVDVERDVLPKVQSILS
jgi:hypothetical protein